MSNEIKASVSDLKHKFYGERFDNQGFGITDSLSDDGIDQNFLLDLIEIVKRSASLGGIEIPEWVVTDDDFVEWVRSHE